PPPWAGGGASPLPGISTELESSTVGSSAPSGKASRICDLAVNMRAPCCDGPRGPAETLTGTCAAPGTGFEPVTLRLTAACSTAELTRKDPSRVYREIGAAPYTIVNAAFAPSGRRAAGDGATRTAVESRGWRAAGDGAPRSRAGPRSNLAGGAQPATERLG